jgi:hypothetical protein
MGWFEPACPVSDEEKAWVDGRMSWLVTQFGIERLRTGTLVLPTEEFFPDPYDESEEAMTRMFHRVCGYMDVDTARVQVEFFSDPCWAELVPGYRLVREGPSFGGLYDEQETVTIRLEIGLRYYPMAMVGVMAHELGHFHLLGCRRITQEEEDHEPLTDLTALFLGLGIFGANSAVPYTQPADTSRHGWGLSATGYLTHPFYAYALALYAWVRGDTHPAWSKHLCADVRGMFKSALRYLVKTGDTGFNSQAPAQ